MKKVFCIISKTFLAIHVVVNFIIANYFFFIMFDVASGLIFYAMSLLGVVLFIRIKEIKSIKGKK